jgi:hypothetical protein
MLAVLLLLSACASAPHAAAGDTAWWPPCTDADGDFYCVEDGDCDDTNIRVNTGEPECVLPADGLDNNCDGRVDECDCASAGIYAGAAEVCDGVDNDCDGQIDEDGTSRWYADADGDGFGDPAVSLVGCAAPPGYAASADDCDDADPAINPAAAEVENGLDDDCDGVADG